MTARRILGAPVSWLFGAVVAFRNVAYDRGWLRVARAAVPVISVGNIAAGGTGKTPLVEWVARFLQERGARVGVLSRGYGRRTTGYLLVSGADANPDAVGDEPAQMAQTLSTTGTMPAIVIAVDEDRVRGAERLVREHGVSVIVLDDGFQHRRLARDLDIVLLTAKELADGGALLPAGNWREPLSSVRRAGAVVITRCVTSEIFDAARRRLPGTAAPVCGVCTRVHAIRRAAPSVACDLSALRSEKALIVAGIGDPNSFAASLTEVGIRIVAREVFPDHHRFSDADLDRVEDTFRRSGATVIMTTQKDAVRMRSQRALQFLHELPAYTVTVRHDPVTDIGPLESILRSVARVA